MLYIIRHGKTDWNAMYKLQGRTDIPLNEEGRQMAKDAKEECKDIHFDICYSSPLMRAKETAEIILEGTGTEIICDDRLREMSFGDCEGKVEVRKHPEWFISKLFDDPANYKAEKNAESFEALYARTGAFLKEVLAPELKAGKTVLVVGHGAMNCSILNQLSDTPISDFWRHMTGNCKLVKVEDTSALQ